MDAIFTIPVDIEIVNKELQHKDCAKITLSFISTRFNGRIDKYPV